MIELEKIAKTVNADGTTITYQVRGTGQRWLIQSRKRHIPHNGRPGTWDHTSYFVLKDGAVVCEKARLSDAKEYAEQYIEKETR